MESSWRAVGEPLARHAANLAADYFARTQGLAFYQGARHLGGHWAALQLRDLTNGPCYCTSPHQAGHQEAEQVYDCAAAGDHA